VFSWRAAFYFLAIFGGVSLFAFILFKDTFRRERSLSYQTAVKQAIRKANKNKSLEHNGNAEKREVPTGDIEAQNPNFEEIRIGLRQMHMFRPMFLVLRRVNNLCILVASGLIYGGITYCLSYTVVRTFGAPPYNYGSLTLGLVLLSFGVGNMLGSLLGGRWSDRTRKKYQREHGGLSKPEHRLHSTKIMMPLLPASVIAYGWMAEKHVNIGGICVILFLIGFSSLWIYSSTLAYIVDANTGRSSSAVAINSFFRGLAAFIAAEVAVPLQNALKDSGLYSLMAGVMVIECILVLLVMYKGSEWRERAEQTEKEKQKRIEEKEEKV